jgi:hypothetical protein
MIIGHHYKNFLSYNPFFDCFSGPLFPLISHVLFLELLGRGREGICLLEQGAMSHDPIVNEKKRP